MLTMSDDTSRTPDTMTLISWTHDKKLMQNLYVLRVQDLFFDCILVAEGETLPVHKLVMAACSDYFYVMFSGDMQESKQSQVELNGVSPTSLKSLVDFAYTGRIDVCMENVGEVVSTANYFQMTDVVDLCADFLKENLSSENVVDILNLAETHALQRIQKDTEMFMQKEFENIPEEILMKLSTQQLVNLLSKDLLSVSNEYQLFKKIMSWMEQSYVTGETVVELLSTIRFPLMSEEVLSRVAENEIMRSSPKCQELFAEALEYRKDVLRQPLMQSGRTRVRAKKSAVISSGSTISVIGRNQGHYGYYQLKNIELYESADIRLKEIVVVDNFLYTAHCLHSRKTQECVLFHRYDPRFDAWQKLPEPSMKWELSLVLVPYNGEIYAMNGKNETSVELEVFSIECNKWEKKTPVSNRNRFFAGIAFQDQIYISGGEELGRSDTKVYCYTPSSDTWETKSPMNVARKRHKMAEIDGKLFAFAGDKEPVSVEYYLPSVDQWTLCDEIFEFPVYGLVDFEEGLCLLGMYEADPSVWNDVDGIRMELYDPETNKASLVLISAFTIQPNYKVMCATLSFPRR